MIPLTAAETRRLFNLHTRVTRPRAARPAPENRTTPAEPEITRRCCSTRARRVGGYAIPGIVVFFFWLVVVILVIILLAFIVHWAGGGVLNLRLGHFALNIGFT
jgi:hypothetical protein